MSTVTSEVIEAVARALCLSWGYAPKILDDIGTYSHQEMWKDGRPSATVAINTVLPFFENYSASEVCDNSPGSSGNSQGIVSSIRNALEELSRDDFAGSNGISVYAAASNELVRRTKIAKDALSLLTSPTTTPPEAPNEQ